MRRLKALIRRRSYDEKSPVPPERNTARLSDARRSLGSNGRHSTTKEDRHITGLNLSKGNESPVEHGTVEHKSPNSQHEANTNTISLVAVQPNLGTSIGKISERQRNMLVKNHRKDVTRKDMPGHFYSDKLASTEEQPKKSSTEIQHSKDRQLAPSMREPDRPVEILHKEDNATRPGERSGAGGEKTVIDLRDTVDTDETITYAPAVTHETIRPQVHEILEEQIYREIHNHDVYHRIQPVYEVEILPARHFVPGPNGGLVEVPEDSIPECTGANQNWHVSKKPPRAASLPTLRQPECIVEDNAVREPIEKDAERGGDLKPTKTQTTTDDQDVKDVYFDSWQSSAARIF
ncbi:hypothetical protein F4813DRAFT_257564 [Daldinia decipiens]|uniref:uncharacterized protein n=1 Tax=Daldinia decipiens TaxID=326647 RepID=UPI0020C1CCEA|nr:uncharacterized protein F4813DRAFT_257564 [Daldinia decipiens]KAI1653432.1 hypothetical protein F4813DRAFT_257564 [Daldinia decipiens]